MDNQSKPDKLDIKNGFLFPWYFHFLAFIMVGVAIPLFTDRTILAIILLLLGVLIISAHSGVEIDGAKKVYKEYMSLLMIKRGKEIKYETVERLYINKSRSRHQMYTSHTGHSSTFVTESYDAYIRFENGAKVYLMSKRNKEKLKTRLQKVSFLFDRPVDDNTEGT